MKHLKAGGTYMPTAVALSGFSDLGAREAYDRANTPDLKF